MRFFVGGEMIVLLIAHVIQDGDDEQVDEIAMIDHHSHR